MELSNSALSEPAEPTLTPGRAIVTPQWDALLTGGLLAVCIAALAIYAHFVPADQLLTGTLVFTLAINGTHFLASYRLLYVSKENVLRYKSAAIYVPAFLVAYGVAALLFHAQNPATSWGITSMLIVSSLYLALHYTGQAWGMMASFAFIERVQFLPKERLLLRSSLRLLALWQMGWSLHYLPEKPEWLIGPLAWLMPLLHVSLAIAAFLGLFIFHGIRRRYGGTLPCRIYIPFLSLFIWYGCLWVYPQAIFWVQIAHALQYLPFPARVEYNRLRLSKSSATALRELGTYCVITLALSCLVFGVIPWAIHYNEPGKNAAWVVILSIINIHHFYIDGCVWHIQNPEVRRNLFSHLH